MTPNYDEQPSPHGGGYAFELHQCVGRGGFGDVYRATAVSPAGVRTVVAIKVLRPGVDPFGHAVERLRDEARLLSAIDHPAILQVRDLIVVRGRVGLVTEYVDGADLSVLMKPENRLSPRMLAECLADVARGLDAAWSTPGPDGAPMQLVHRDIKPANLRVSRHGTVKLLDFGIALANVGREPTPTGRSTGTEPLVGTYPYMAPERFQKVDGPEGDVYALACLLYQGLSGRRFLAGCSLLEHCAVVATPESYEPRLFQHLQWLPPRIPNTTQDLLRRALAFAPSDRPTAAELATALEAEAPLLPGLSRGAWCRAHPFPEPERTGELTGIRVVDEVQVTPTLMPRSRRTPPTEPSRPRHRDTPWWVWAGLLAAMAALGAGLTSLSAGVVLGQRLASTTVTVPRTLEVPRAAVTVAPPSTEVPETVEPAAAEPVEEPVPAAPQTGRVAIETDVPVRLIGPNGNALVPLGQIPAGTYALEADFGDGYGTAGSGIVSPGRSHVVRCAPDIQACTLGP
ncbi:MAG: serine/threonine-protein kinase [Myxococcota bacterium]